jgi:hypothetical protein
VKNLYEIRSLVRTSLDVDAEELPDVLIDTWCREVSRRIARKQTRTPWLECSWEVTTVPNQAEYPLAEFSSSVANTAAKVTAVRSSTRRLEAVGVEESDAHFAMGTDQGAPSHYLVREAKLVLYPIPTEAEALQVRGYRKAMDWVSGANDFVPDMPEDFEDVIFNWVLGKAYAQQEDPDMGIMYMDLADEELRLLTKQEVSDLTQPLVIGGGVKRRGPRGRARWDWE